MSPKRQLTPSERTEQIRHHRGNMILEAGAGTGKTFSITERVIHQIVEEQIPLERLLALTFTDFAAAEMRSRIYEAVNTKLDEEVSSSEHSERKRRIEHLRQTRRAFPRNFISTFHAFCNRMLRFFPDELASLKIPEEPEMGPFIAASDDEPVATGTASKVLQVEGSFELLSDYEESLRMIEWRKTFYSKYKGLPVLERQLSRLQPSQLEPFLLDLGQLEDEDLKQMAAMSPDDYLDKLNYLAQKWNEEKETYGQSVLEELRANPQWFSKPENRPQSMAELFGKGLITSKNELNKRKVRHNEIDTDTWQDLNEHLKLFCRYHYDLESVTSFFKEDNLRDRLLSYQDHETFDENTEAWWNMKDLAELTLRWHYLMRYLRFREGFFNYDDMIWLTHRLLTHHPDVIAQVRGRFDQVLVDEFQDTDQRQWDIIRMIALGESKTIAESDPGGKKRRKKSKQVLIVGDVKQAIYRFRGGDVAMMRQAERELKKVQANAGQQETLPARIPLEYSFRSNEAIVSFTNRLFRSVLPLEAQAASFEAWHQPLSLPPEGLSKNASSPGEVRICLADTKKLKEGVSSYSVSASSLLENIFLLEARQIAAFLKRIQDGEAPGYDRITEKMKANQPAIGILYRRRKYIHAMEQALAEAGLSYTVAKGVAFFERREILDAWVLVSFFLDAYDDLSLAGLLRSPMIGLSDSGLLEIRMVMDVHEYQYTHFWVALEDYDSWIDKLTNEKDRFVLKQAIPFLQKMRKGVPVYRVSELFEKAFFTEGVWFGGFAGDIQVRENLVKLLEMIRKLEKSGQGTLFEIHRFMSDRIGKEAKEEEAQHPDPASIQLMTIHGAKGLQFPMVVIPDMYAAGSPGGLSLYISASDSDSLTWPAISYKKGDRNSEKDSEESFLQRVLKIEHKQRQEAELKRLFYVAITRAETHLFLSMVKPPKAKKSGTFAACLETWMNKEDIHYFKRAHDKKTEKEGPCVMLEELTPEEVEFLAKITLETVDTSPNGITPVRLDRNSHWFKQAEEAVANEIVASSGMTEAESEKKKRIVYDIGDPDLTVERNDASNQEANTFSGITAADAGTLIHRSMEMGFDSELVALKEERPKSHENKPGEDQTRTALQKDLFSETHDGSGIEDFSEDTNDKIIQRITRFWQRELLGMGYKDALLIVKDNQEELLRHCRNAGLWLFKNFGRDAQKRFETAFEYMSREEERRVLIRGVMDLVITGHDGNDHIVDFKTGPLPVLQGAKVAYRPTEIKSILEKAGYIQQIISYQQAYKVITGKEIPASRIWLLFTSPDSPFAVSLEELNGSKPVP